MGTTAFWKFQRKVRKDVTNPETIAHIRRFFMTRGQPRNAGAATTAAADRRGAWNRDFYVGKRGKKGDRQPGTQRLFLGETPKRAHQSWLKTVPSAGPKVRVVGYTVFWREKPSMCFQLRRARLVAVYTMLYLTRLQGVCQRFARSCTRRRARV